MADTHDDAIPIVRIPADVDQPDKIVAGLTVRQAAVLGAVALLLWLGFQACRPAVLVTAYLVASALILLATAVVVTMSRDGVPLDRLFGAWLAFRRTPSRQVLAPEGLVRAPRSLVGKQRERVAQHKSVVRDVNEGGVLDLGPDGVTALAECTTVNLTLRSQREQSVLLAGFARWLNSLTASVAVTVRTRPADLSAVGESIRDQAAALADDSLRAAAHEHVAFLNDFATAGNLLTREVTLAVHERSKDAAPRLHRRIEDADALLGCADISVTGLSETATTALLDQAFNPGSSVRHAMTSEA